MSNPIETAVRRSKRKTPASDKKQRNGEQQQVPMVYSLLFAGRLVVLFSVGCILALLVDSMQRSHNITKWPNRTIISTAWVPISSGLAACLVGTLYPLLDDWLLDIRAVHSVKRDWSSSLRFF